MSDPLKFGRETPGAIVILQLENDRIIFTLELYRRVYVMVIMSVNNEHKHNI